MENIITMPNRLDYCFGFQAVASVASLDLCTNLIIFLNGEVISLASLNSNYNVRQRRKKLSKCISQIVLCLSTQAATHRYTRLYKQILFSISSQTQLFVTFVVIQRTSHLQTETIEDCSFASLVWNCLILAKTQSGLGRNVWM